MKNDSVVRSVQPFLICKFKYIIYDTLKSVKSQELTIPHNLTLPIPQDYVNYVQLSWIDQAGVKHIIYPTSKTSNPHPILQNSDGDLITNINVGKITFDVLISQDYDGGSVDFDIEITDEFDGQTLPDESQYNGKYTIPININTINFLNLYFKNLS